MNDFERIYTVIKSQYSCGVPYYNYDSCTYDQLSNMYYQQGTLNLPSSTGYSNVYFNDIPVACGFPNLVYRQCIPSDPPDDEEEPIVEQTPGFRININGSYVLPDDNSLILKNPLGFNMDIETGEEAKRNLSNSLYLFEKRGFNNCIKHINTNKYVGVDNSNNFIFTDTCSNKNSFVYKQDKKQLLYDIDKCVNPDKYYQIVPNNTKIILSSCDENINVVLENDGTPIDYYAKLKLLAEKDSILSASVTIPTSLYISSISYKDTQNYNYAFESFYGGEHINKVNYVLNTKCKYSNVSIIIIIQTDTKSCAYISLNNGVNWRQLTNSTTIQDVDISSDGKYITLTDTNNFYVSNNADTNNIILTRKSYPFETNITTNTINGYIITQSYCNVVMSKDGMYQYIYDNKNVIYSEDFGNTFIWQSSTSKLDSSPLCISSNGLYAFFINNDVINFCSEISMVLDYNTITFKLNYIEKALMSYDGKYCYIIDYFNLYCNDNYLNKNNWRITSLNNMKNACENILGRELSIFELSPKSIDMCISKNGKFVYVVYTFLQDVVKEWVGIIFYSNDYGITFTQLKTDDNDLNNNLSKLRSIDVSEDGLNIIFTYNDKIYSTKLKENPDDTLDKNMFISPIISIPAKQYQFMNSYLSQPPLVKNGKNLLAIMTNNIRSIGTVSNFNTFPASNTTSISNICKSFGFNENSFALYTVQNKLYYTSYNYLLNRLPAIEIYETLKNIAYMTFEVREKSIYILLTDLIHYSNDRINWQTVNMIPKKWKMAYIVPKLKNNEYTIYCIEEYGKFYFSYDSGVTWKSNDIIENYYWTSIDTTDDGKIVIATIKNNYPLISYDDGLSFSFLKIDEILIDNSGNFIKQFVDCAISAHGKIISLIIDNGRIMNSYDYGVSWNYYGQYDFYQYGMKFEDLNKLYFITTSFVFTRTTGYTYSSTPLNMILTGNNFSFEVNTMTNPTYTLQGTDKMIYIGLNPGTYDASANLTIKADYIQIKYIYYLKLKYLLIGGGTTSSSIFNGIEEIIIMGSNDDVNFYKINLQSPLPRTKTISKVFKIFVENENYYNTYRIIFIVKPWYNAYNQLVNTRTITYLNLEGDISYYTTEFNKTSRWKYVVYNYDNTLLYNRDNEILQGFDFNPIFVDYNINRNISDIIYSSDTTLNSDLYVNNLTINSGITLRTNGFRIFCRGKLINNGTITNDGNVLSNGNKLGKGSEGGNGGIGSSTITSSSSGRDGTVITITISNNNGLSPTGGRGGNRSNNSVLGGSGGDTTIYLKDLTPNEAIVFRTSNLILQGGSGGGGGAGGSGTSLHNGGKGGRGGGIIMICANEIENNGTITVKGEDGKSPNSFSSSTILGGGGGGGGGGGNIVIVTKYTANFSNTGYIVSGGEGGKGQINTLNSSLSGKNGQNGMDGRLVVVFV